MSRERRRTREVFLGAREAVLESHTVEHVTVSPYQLSRRHTVRSAEVLETVARLDSATDPQLRSQLAAWLEQVYVDRGGGVLIGFFGTCYLGGDYVDHRLLLTGAIAEHFTRSQEPPPPWRTGRPLIRSGAYAFLEVYDDGVVIPVRPDGSSVI